MCFVTAGLVVWGAVYTRNEGFTDSWRDAIEREFESRGYFVDIGKLTLGAFRGLVAEDVRFFQDVTRNQEVAFIDDVYLDVDLSRILDRKKISINTLDVQEASLSLPLESSKPDGRRLRVVDLSGRIVVTESVIEIVKAEATVAGVNVLIKGSLVRPPLDEVDDDTGMSEEMLERRRGQLLKVLTEIETLEFTGGRPSVEIEFRGDLDNIAASTAKARVQAPAFSKRGHAYTIETLSANLSLNGLEGRAEIDELVVRDKKGALNLTGAWSQNEGGRFSFDLESDADMSSLAGLFWQDKKLGEVVFFKSPSVTASGYLDLTHFLEKKPGFPGEIIGELRAERFVTRGTVFAGLDFGFSASGERFYIRNLRLDHITGVAFLNLKYEPGNGEDSIQYQAEVKLDPLVFRPFFHEKGRKFIDAWNFGETSAVYIAAVGRGVDWKPSSWDYKGVIDLRHFRLNGVTFLEMESDFEAEGTTQWFRNVSLVRDEGHIVAELAKNNLETKQWEVKGVVSTVDPVEGARAFSPMLSRALTRYRHATPPTVRIAGLIDARRNEEVGTESRRNKLDISFSGGGDAQYDFLGKTLVLTDPKGEVKVDGSHVHLTTLTAGVFGGSIELNYDAKNVRIPEKPFDMNVRVTGVPLEKVTKHYGDVEEITGSVDADFTLRGNAGQIPSFAGQGSARISEGHLFGIPVLGPLSKLISKGSPANQDAGHSIAREASATFRIENGIIMTEDIEALTQAFRVKGAGTVSLIDKSVDLEAVVNTRGGISSAIFTPVSELLTYSCTGTIMEPVWKPKHISTLGKIPAQLISEITNIPIEGLRKLGQGLFGTQEEREAQGAARREREETGAGQEAAPAPPRRLFQLRSN